MGDFLTEKKASEVIKDAMLEDSTLTYDIAIDDLVNAGYEIEGYNTEFSPLEAVKNIPESTLEFGKAIWSALTRPDQTITAMSSLAKGAMRTASKSVGLEVPENTVGLAAIFGGSEQDEELFKGMIDFFKDRYGTDERVLETIERDPAGFLSDATTLISGGGTAITKIGGVSKLSKVEEIGSVITKIGRGLEPTKLLGAASKPMRAVVRKFNETVGINKILRSASNRFMAKASGLSAPVRRDLFKDIGIKPDEFLAKHGIHGTLEDIYGQLDNIGGQTKIIVDNLLGQFNDTYKLRSADKILNELRGFFGKETSDIVEGIVNAKGKPYKGTESVFVQMENMSQKFEESLSEIQGLLQKNKTRGLTLTELNRVKRIGDEVFDVFKRSGEVKGQRTAQNIANLRKEIREFIEIEADKKGISDIKELNKQTQAANSIKREIGEIIGVTETRSAIGDQLIFLMGLTGSAATVNIAPLIGAGAVVGGREVVRLPRIRSFMSTRLRLMADGDYQELLRGVESGKQTSKFKQILKRETNLLRKAFPELRLMGITKEKYSRGVERSW